MKNALTRLILALGLLHIATPTNAGLQQGFQGIGWGSPSAATPALTRLHEKGDVTYYARPNEVRTIRDLPVGRVIYGFYRDRFFAAYLHIVSEQAYGEIRSRLMGSFGPPRRTAHSPDETVSIWKAGDIKIKLKRGNKKNRDKIAFYYAPISNKLNETTQEKSFERSYRFLPIDKNKRPQMLPLLEF